MNLVQKFEQNQIASLSEGKNTPDFKPGDTVRVHVRIIEGANERIQAYEGLCISKTSRGVGSNFTVRKISHNEGVERTFPLCSPKIDSIEIVKKGIVRRTKLYYMRELRGKAARIQEKLER
jgi:large subunit ribosomal protein L19